MIKNKFGDGFTEYNLLDNCYMMESLSSNINFHGDKVFTLPDFLYKIDHDNFCRVMLVYCDNNGENPHIKGYVNNEVCFYIHFNEDQYKEISSSFISNEYLKALMARTITIDEYKRLEEIYFNLANGEENPNINGFTAKYLQYLNYCFYSAQCNISKNIFDVLLYLDITLGSIYLYRYAINISENQHTLANCISAAAVTAMVASVGLLPGKIREILTPYILLEKDNNIATILKIKNQRESIQMGFDIFDVKRKKVDEAKKDFYMELKRAFKVISELDKQYANSNEEQNRLYKQQRSFYIANIKDIIKDFNQDLEEIFANYVYSDKIEETLVESIQRLYQAVPQIDTNFEVYQMQDQELETNDKNGQAFNSRTA